MNQPRASPKRRGVRIRTSGNAVGSICIGKSRKERVGQTCDDMCRIASREGLETVCLRGFAAGGLGLSRGPRAWGGTGT
jgi:hypothetical protein